MKIENKPSLAIFDLGNVVFQVDWEPMFESWSNASGVSTAKLKSNFKFDENFEAFERGQIGGNTFHERLCETLGATFDYEQFVAGWNSIYYEVVPQVQLSLEQLQGKLKVVAFTNTNKVHSLVWPEKYRDALTKFEHIFASSEMGLRKPELDGFKHVLAHCGVQAQEAIFFDDFPPNIEAAEAIGLRAVLVDSPEAVTNALNRLNLID